MGVYSRSFFAIFLVAVVIVGCGKPVPPPATQPSSSPAVSATPTPPVKTTVQPKEQPASQQQDVARQLDQIEQLLATAKKSTLFVEAKPVVLVRHSLGPGPGVVESAAPAPGAAAPGAAAPRAPVAPAAQPSAVSDYKVVPVDNGGTIAGFVSYVGKPRPPKVIKVEKTPEVCGKEDRELYEVSVNDGKLQDVVLLLEEVKEGKPFDSLVLLGPPPGGRGGADTGEYELFPGTDIKPQKCIFGAFTGVIAQSSVLRFDNLDPVKHSPHTYAVKGRVRKSMHNQDLEGNGKLELPIALKKGYKAIKLECDQHPHMQNWFRLVDNPYYAFSTADGTFTIDKVPPGTYKLIAWHPILGEHEQKVTVAATGTVDVNFEFSSKRRRS